jgi:hypothetical protein
MKHVSLLIILIVAFPILVFSQKPEPTQKVSERQRTLEKQNQDDLKRSKAVYLVEQTASEAVLWDDREAAVSALTQAADLLWDENLKARVWLTKAWDLIEKIDERENSEELRQIWRGSQGSRLRTIVLNVALRRDSKLADCFLQKLELSQVDDKAERGAFDDHTARSEQLLRLAMNAIETNPALALNLAERSLGDGISFNLQTVLLRLRQKDVGLANRLFDSALARLVNGPTAFSDHQVLASYLFKPGQVPARLPDGNVTVAVVQTQLPAQSPAEFDPARARSFLIVVHRRLLAEPFPLKEQSQAAAEFILLTNSLAQPFQMYAPDLWVGIQARTQFAAAAPKAWAKPNAEVTETVREAARNGAPAEEVSRLRVDALEKVAEKEFNLLARKLRFAEAALATAPKDFERGKGLANRIENDDKLHQQIVAFLYYRAALTCFAENDLEKAEELALKIPSSLERALTLIAVAQKLAAVKPQSKEETWTSGMAHQRAVELLFEADKSLKREDASPNIAKVRLGKTAISYLVDSSQALIDFEQAIAIINRLERFDPTDEGAPRLGIEGFSTTKFTVPRVSFGFGFRNALEPLVTEDFDRTAAAIDGLASPSVRGLCRLEAARQILYSVPKISVQVKAAQAKLQ